MYANSENSREPVERGGKCDEIDRGIWTVNMPRKEFSTVFWIMLRLWFSPTKDGSEKYAKEVSGVDNGFRGAPCWILIIIVKSEFVV